MRRRNRQSNNGEADAAPLAASAKRTELDSIAPNTCREVIKPKEHPHTKQPEPGEYLNHCELLHCLWHLTQGAANFPQQFAHYTNQLFQDAAGARVSACLRRNSSRLSGGYSFDVSIVHNTHDRKAAAPILNDIEL